MRRQPDHQSRVFYELSALILNIIRSPPAAKAEFSGDDDSPELKRRSAAVPRLPPISPAGFASLLLGISLALMLCGSVTFFFGFMLMPWAIGLMMVFYVVGIVWSLSMIGRAILCYNSSSSSSSLPRKEAPAWKLL